MGGHGALHHRPLVYNCFRMTPLRIGDYFGASPGEDLWSARLEKLQAIREQHPEGPTWLWNMRIRILTFLVSRYATRAADELRHEAAQPESVDVDAANDFDPTDQSEWSLPIVRYFRSPNLGEHPPRTRETLSAVLDKISDENDSSRSLTGRRPPLDSVWTWWRETYAASRRA